MRIRRRGRPRHPRRVEVEPDVTYFKPRGVPMADLEVAELTVEELEALRLVDLEGLEQDQAAIRMGVSRRALWSELDSARRKVAGALVKGSAIAIRGGNYVTAARRFECSSCGRTWDEPFGTGRPCACPGCGSPQVARQKAGCRCGKVEEKGR
jgi:predicted DNA-binding protein (UPF0251 family)